MIVATESWEAYKFSKGLKIDIFDWIDVWKPNSYVKVLEHAQLAKELIAAWYR